MKTKIKAEAKWVRISPRKLKRVIDFIRGKSPAQAQVFLKFLPHKGARILEKVIQSALANAKNNYKMKEENLFIAEIFVNKGITFLRYQPRARGRIYPIRKRTSHVKVFLGSREGE